MENDLKKTRINNIKRMIIEMGCGNFSYRIPRSEQEDELEALSVLLNMMAEEMRELLYEQNKRNIFKHIVQMTFVLNANFRIEYFSEAVPKILMLKENELKGILLTDLLTEESKKELEQIKIFQEGSDAKDTIINLFFKTKESFIVPAFCSISTLSKKLEDPSRFIITAMQTVIRSESTEEKSQLTITSDNAKSKNRKKHIQSEILHLEEDLRKIKEVYHFILENLDRPLPPLYELAHIFGTNEYKLKYGFKQLYNTSIFRFHTNERLKKASLLIQHTPMLLKTVARVTGFKSFPHFSRAFKNEFGYTPSALRKSSRKK